ncbi:unnamed protein product [Adineta steineri]|uniref:Transmembrane protein 53 n=1 Tax=Adineta steineri TaxID=433720 RepID=A0A814NH81_9BILA|nr:unnamed protein product [Adineta steineri]CAF1274989.1 unnamed protein product [Adineta steineri]
MFFILFNVIILGCILYKISDYYVRRYLGFNSIDHTPVYTPGSSHASVLVCVLGWGGCTRRHLRRILNFYSLHEIPTVSWINPMFNYIFGVDMKQIERILDFLIHENRDTKNIIIHLHSNNGALVWSHMLHTMKTNEHYNQLLINIKGVIFDSSPYTRLNSSSVWIIASAFIMSRPSVSIILNRAQYFHWLWTPLVTYYLSLRYLYRRYFSSDPSTTTDKILRIVSSTPKDVKQFYLYSNADRLVPHTVVEQYMAVQVDRGVNVTSHRFLGSGHVNHFRLHPVEYGKLVLDFIVNIENDNVSDK